MVVRDEKKSLVPLIKSWAEGRTTLKDIKGYSDDELYAIAHQGYFFLQQGKNDEARTIFEGLNAIDPRNDYYYRALGVVYHKLGETERALRAFTQATRLAPSNLAAFINRAEIYIAIGRRREALADLDYAVSIARDPQTPLCRKARALGDYLRRRA